jgi:hypothetical protein
VQILEWIKAFFFALPEQFLALSGQTLEWIKAFFGPFLSRYWNGLRGMITVVLGENHYLDFFLPSTSFGIQQ